MNEYELYKAISGRKIYLTVEMDISVTEADAIRIADKYFKAGKNNLICEKGRVIGGDLYLEKSSGNYPITMGVLNYEVWVITRK